MDTAGDLHDHGIRLYFNTPQVNAAGASHHVAFITHGERVIVDDGKLMARRAGYTRDFQVGNGFVWVVRDGGGGGGGGGICGAGGFWKKRVASFLGGGGNVEDGAWRHNGIGCWFALAGRPRHDRGDQRQRCQGDKLYCRFHWSYVLALTKAAISMRKLIFSGFSSPTGSRDRFKTRMWGNLFSKSETNLPKS